MASRPEHEKLAVVKDKSQSIGEFLEWLESEKKLSFGFWHKHGPECEGWDEDEEAVFPTYEWRCDEKHEHDVLNCSRSRTAGCDLPQETMTPARINTAKLLAEFFEIDLDKLEEEKRTMLEEIRAEAS